MKSRAFSINDYEILGLNFDRFSSELVKHYNIINISINSASHFFINYFLLNIKDNKDAFCKELLNKLAIKKIKSLRRKADSEKNFIGHENTDDFFKQQWDYVLDELDELRGLVYSYRKYNSEKDLDLIVFFLLTKSSTIQQAKVLFGLNIDSIINKYITFAPSRAHRKLILGLLDAKINVLAFMQNLSQIIYSDDFLNIDFPGSLVFKQDVVKNIKKLSNAKFLEFKNIQKEIKKRGWNVSMLAELENNTALFMDVLLNDNSIAYARLADQELHDDTISEDSYTPHEFKDIINLSTNFFKLLDSYFMNFEDKEKKSQAKNLARGNPFKKSEIHMIAKRDAWKKLIRIYREENDPLAMILTAQNAMSLIQKKGYSPKKDVLHIMSVNYGGALVGLYAKHTFSRIILDGQLLTNNGSLVYSIYDVKNANSFFKLSDYPFSSIAKDNTLDVDTRRKLKQENWLLIFDDNTNSGETLDNIKRLALDSDFYGRIDAFTCRANADIKKYKKSLTMQQRLDIIGVSGLIARKTRIISSKERYKEIIGTIVGNNLFKIIHRKNRN
ncbi:hypothetical protein HJ586_09425 [Dickeya zeae]|nr:hypothetical protein HJ586_09425 [Dickeya zeae]